MKVVTLYLVRFWVGCSLLIEGLLDEEGEPLRSHRWLWLVDDPRLILGGPDVVGGRIVLC